MTLTLDRFFKYLMYAVVFSLALCLLIFVGVVRGLGYPHESVMEAPLPTIYNVESPKSAETPRDTGTVENYTSQK